MIRLCLHLIVALGLMSLGASAQNTGSQNPGSGAMTGNTTTTAAAAVSVSTPWARATPGTSTIGAAYLTIKGADTAADKLIALTTPVAGRAELHTHIMDKGVMRMRRIDFIEIPAGETVTLQPGGKHLMLFDLKAPLKKGQKIELSLQFEKAGAVVVYADVMKVGSMGPGKMATGKSGTAGSMQNMKHDMGKKRGSHSN